MAMLSTKRFLVTGSLLVAATFALAHGDVNPQPVDTTGLPKTGEEWYVERFREGKAQNGITKMPAFGELSGQDAAWAIRTYIETRPDRDAMEGVSTELRELRDQLAGYGDDPAGADADALKTQLSEFANGIETGSGAPVADPVAFRAANLIDGTQTDYQAAAETLTIGLSAAK